eukprot:675144-Pleurochrysis_carterae.AAC.6
MRATSVVAEILPMAAHADEARAFCAHQFPCRYSTATGEELLARSTAATDSRRRRSATPA